MNTTAPADRPIAGSYLFSYPRSGSNWLLSALVYLLGGVKAEARIGPELYPHTYGEVGPASFWIQTATEWHGDRPLLIKSHDSVATVNALYPSGKTIYLLRDGRDVLISYYFFQKAFVTNPKNKSVFATGRYQQDLGALSGNDVRFDPQEYAEFVRTHAPEWVRHVQSWRQVPDVFTLRYEALWANFEAELTRVGEFLALPQARSVTEVRQEYVENSRSLITGDNRSFHRKGIVGDWKNYCDGEILDLLKSELGETLVTLGYESGLDW